jgi:hypothetical protein
VVRGSRCVRSTADIVNTFAAQLLRAERPVAPGVFLQLHSTQLSVIDDDRSTLPAARAILRINVLSILATRWQVMSPTSSV